MSALSLGAALAGARLSRRPVIVASMLGVALVLVAALVERRFGSAGAVDRSLASAFNVVVPLVSFAVVAEACGRKNLRDAVWQLARYGAPRRLVAFGVVGSAVLVSAVLGAGFAVVAVLVAHAPGNPPLALDAATSAWIAGLTAAAYAGWFLAFATLGARGTARWIPLVLDFVLAGVPGVLGALLPRAHAVSLLGGPLAMGLRPPASAALLAASAVTLSLVAAARCGD